MEKKLDLKPGQKVEVSTKRGAFIGTIVTTSFDSIVLKLSSGYNIFLNNKEIASASVLENKKDNNVHFEKNIEAKENLPTISILMMGGTIASRVDYETGAVKVFFDSQDLIRMFPEVSTFANFKTRLIGKILSEDIRFSHYKKILSEIKKEITAGGIKGIIVPHGTDTMHYTSAALAFAIENPPVPIILVGAQRSSDRGSSDAAQNLLAAVQFIAKTDFKGVGICMHENTDDSTCVILPATKTRKMHVSRRDSFKPINTLPIARVNTLEQKTDFLSKPENASGPFRVFNKFEEKVGIIKARPNMFSFEFDFFRKNKFKGLVIEGTGLGHAPVGVLDELAKDNKKNLLAIKNLVKSGCIVVMASQCINGFVQMHVYQNGVFLTNLGVLPSKDMTAETAYIKLAWLLGNFPREKVKELFIQNLRGEINKRSQMNFFPPKI